MAYLGPRITKSNGPYKFKIHADEILILQTGTSCVFKGSLKPNDKFNFKSNRLMNGHFALDVYVNGIIDQHIFACCEKGFVNQCHFQPKRYSCQLKSITGGIPCQICQYDDFDETDLDLVTDQPVNIKIKIEDTPGLKTIPKHKTTEEKETAVFKETSVDQETKNVNSSEPQKNQFSKIKPTQIQNDNDQNQEKKIMNENTQSNISPVAAAHMQDLLKRYLNAFQQTKFDEMKTTTATDTHTLLNIESDRDVKASMQYISSSTSTSVSSLTNKAESFVLIWLDRSIQEHHDAVDSEKNLRAIVNSLITCKTINETEDIIKQIENQQIYLIVSGELGEILLSMKNIVECSKLNSIYIFCRDKNKHKHLCQRSDKVRGIYIKIKSLCEQLENDTKQAIENLLSISTTSDINDDTMQQIKFLCSQLHCDLLFTMEYNTNAMSDLLKFCSNAYHDNPIELDYMEKFKKNYHPGKAITWYTENTFLYKMLNKAFRDQDVLTLYKFQFYIKDLHMQLEQMHGLYKRALESKVFTVYRGLNMPMKEFQNTIRAKQNQLITFDSFLSTTLDPNTAKLFALKKQDKNHESILFTIEIDTDHIERPFADISRRSVFKREREILFSIGTVFRIDKVAEERNNEGLWIVHLSTVSKEDKQFQVQIQELQEILLEFFQVILDIRSNHSDDQRIAQSHATLGSMYYKQGNFEKSLASYDEARTYLLKHSSPDDDDKWTKAIYIENVAKTHLAMENIDQALSFYQQALEIHRQRDCQPNDSSLINTLHKIGDIYCRKKQWDDALNQYQNALDLLLSSLESDQYADLVPIATSYICIGNVYAEQNKYGEALKAFQQALIQQKEHLTEHEHHPVLAFLYNNIGAMHYKLKDYKEALVNQEKCLEIELKSFPEEHSTFAATYQNIFRTYAELRQYDKATEYAEKCIHILEHDKMKDNSETLNYVRQRLERYRMYNDAANDVNL